MPRVISENFTMKPMRATAHIQNTAPGPPVAMATDTPAMFQRGGQRRAAGLERGNIALAVALVEDLAERVLHGVSEPGELEELKADGQVHSDCGCQEMCIRDSLYIGGIISSRP